MSHNNGDETDARNGLLSVSEERQTVNEFVITKGKKDRNTKVLMERSNNGKDNGLESTYRNEKTDINKKKNLTLKETMIIGLQILLNVYVILL